MRLRVTADIETEPRLGITLMKVERLSSDSHAARYTLYPPGAIEQKVRSTVEESDTLALDDEGDREELIVRLVKALTE